MTKFATMSLRTTPSFADETSFFAQYSGVSKTQYLEQAIKEKNERVLADRISFLSSKLSAQSLAHSEAMDAAVGDGIG